MGEALLSVANNGVTQAIPSLLKRLSALYMSLLEKCKKTEQQTIEV